MNLHGSLLSQNMSLCRILHSRSWLNAANDEKQIKKGPMYKQANVVSWYSQHNKEQVKNFLRAKPVLGLMFKLSMPFVNPMDLEHLRFPDDVREPDCCCTIVPDRCALITLDTYGVVINNNEMKDPLNYGDNIVYLYLPEIPNVSKKVVATNSLEDMPTIERKAIKGNFEAPIR